MGRSADVAVIERVLASARLGSSAALLVTGEPGVGKSSLLAAAADRAAGMRLLRATCVEADRELPFAGLLQMVRPVLDRIDTLPERQAIALGEALALRSAGPDESTDRFTVGAALLALIADVAEQAPVAVLVDDVHLMDLPSLEALGFVARRLGADAVALVAAARTPEAGQDADGWRSALAGVPEHRLTGLSPAGVRELLPQAVDPDSLHRLTQGNPLALLELGDAELDAMESDAAGHAISLPQAVTAAFVRRLAGLSAGCRTVLLLASITNGDVLTVAAAAPGLGADVRELAEAEDREVVAITDGRIGFRHPLLRAAVYAAASIPERRAAHAAVAQVVSDPDRRAWHLAEAVWYPDDEVAAAVVDAGRRALARSAFAVASSAFERAAHLSTVATDRAAHLWRAADAAWTAGNGIRAIDLLDQLDEATEPTARYRELQLRGTIALRSGSLASAVELFSHAAEVARTAGDAKDAAAALADAVQASFYLGDAAGAGRLAERIGDLSPISSQARGPALLALGIARVFAGDGSAAELRSATHLLEGTARRDRDPRLLTWLVLASLFLRDGTDARRITDLVEESRDALGPGSLPGLLFLVARGQATSQAWTQAAANYAESVRLASETHQSTELAMSLAGLAWLESRQGRPDECRRHAAEALAICRERGIHLGTAWVDYALGDLELSLGNASEAVARLRSLVDRLAANHFDDPDLLPAPELVEALLRSGEREAATQLAADYLARATAKGRPWALARAYRAHGQVADGFDESFTQALARHEETTDRFEAARTRLAYGERLRRAGRRVDARRQLRVAVAELDRLGAAVWSDRAAAELAATGETVRRTQAGLVADLTAQELQVCQLLVDGRSTREAAAALFLSPKTVEYHLRKVYLKLGIRSRAELALALER